MTQLPSLPPIEPTMLVGLFAATIQPEETARKQAESHLKEVFGQLCHPAGLFVVCGLAYWFCRLWAEPAQHCHGPP